MSLVMETMKRTEVMVFDRIERPLYRDDLYPLDRIRDHFQFRFATRAVPSATSSSAPRMETVVQFRKRSSEDENVVGDDWQEQRFVATGKKSRTTKGTKRKRDVRPINDAGAESGAEGGTPTPAKRARAKPQATAGVKPKAKAKAKVKAKAKAKAKGKAKDKTAARRCTPVVAMPRTNGGKRKKGETVRAV